MADELGDGSTDPTLKEGTEVGSSNTPEHSGLSDEAREALVREERARWEEEQKNSDVEAKAREYEKIEAERKAEEERLKLEEENKKKELEAKGREYEKIEALLATKDGQNEIDKKVIPSKDIKTFSVKKDHFTKVVGNKKERNTRRLQY